ATGGPFAEQFQSPFGATDGAHTVMDAAWPEARLGNGKTTALFAEAVGHWHPHIVVVHLGMPALADVVKDWQGPYELKPWGVEGHQNHRGALVGWCGRVRHGHHDSDPAVGMESIGREPLAPCDYVVVTVAHGASLEISWIRTGHGWLGHRETAP